MRLRAIVPLLLVLTACAGTPEAEPTTTVRPTTTSVPVTTTTTVVEAGPFTFDFALQRGRENPALDDGSTGDWDSTWTFAPGVLHHDGRFHMFYTGWNNVAVIRIGYAVSDDGLDFERVTDGPVLEFEPEDPSTGIWTPIPFVQDDGTWVLFVGTSRKQVLSDRVLRATAPAPTGPWTWDEEPIYTGAAEGWDADVLPQSLARTPDGGLVIAYENAWCNDTRIGLLLSEDGEDWRPYDDPTTTEEGRNGSDPVFGPTGGEDDWDRQATSSPLIFATDDGYELFYLGQHRNNGSQMSKFDHIWLGYATSPDGVAWERHEENPVIELTGEESGCPWMSGVRVAGTYYLYLALDAGRYGIGVITGTVGGGGG